MTSLQTSIKQIPADGGYFITIGNLEGKVYSYNGTTFSAADWDEDVDEAGKLLKDMGKTLIVNGSTFRKVQLVNATPATFGVGGDAEGAGPYNTGYIQLGFDGNGTAAPVAQFGR
jgi:hypothetical protein